MLGNAAGAAVVADLRSVTPMVRTAVLMLRDWCNGPDGQLRVRSAFVDGLSAAEAQAGTHHFEALVRGLTLRGRRPFLRHALACRCVGADEAVFANLLAVAASGEHEDAMLIASLLVPGEVLPLVVNDAAQAGLAIRRIVVRQQSQRHAPLH
ncbi:hypothetical protein [Jannaschia rubra]|uniref:hypothetical protein n=1 Tax=Jannaschia rubra TaxID=282197 RepID=UPI0024933643|nr:hypothetical protein [Jannaschia rubra]